MFLSKSNKFPIGVYYIVRHRRATDNIIPHFEMLECACKQSCGGLGEFLLHRAISTNTNMILPSYRLLKISGMYLKCHKIQLNIICETKLRFSQLVLCGYIVALINGKRRITTPNAIFIPCCARRLVSSNSIMWFRLISGKCKGNNSESLSEHRNTFRHITTQLSMALRRCGL